MGGEITCNQDGSRKIFDGARLARKGRQIQRLRFDEGELVTVWRVGRRGSSLCVVAMHKFSSKAHKQQHLGFDVTKSN